MCSAAGAGEPGPETTGHVVWPVAAGVRELASMWAPLYLDIGVKESGPVVMGHMGEPAGMRELAPVWALPSAWP